ncbi:metalloregulator ArsR/SmtB family transcription factor [Opitutia bacterium ISCC 51]|nr:metalloregulator ArsR/SmtB family transcription factor [Opitutae bacterium ISCC 51]QXD26505.1 metalloregulator ArsR/SmtB family transcription factor [Opitutae bacterium ISCC 52]
MNSKQAAAFGKAVGDVTRYAILRNCCSEKRSVGDIAEHVKLRQPTVTHHMSILTEAGLVTREQEGKQVYYRVNQEAVVNCCGQLLLALAPDQKATQAVCDCC